MYTIYLTIYLYAQIFYKMAVNQIVVFLIKEFCGKILEGGIPREYQRLKTKENELMKVMIISN